MIEDATIENAKDVLSEVRDGVGIDRFYGVASDKAKYDREILPKGTKLNFQMTVEVGEKQNALQTKAIFQHLLEALQIGEIRFGGSRTRGLGKLILTNRSFKEQNFDGFANMLRVLKNEFDDVKITDEIKESIKFHGNTRLDISINWSPVQPLMVKAGFEGIGVDILPLVSQKENGRVSLILPGSSIKGALRSHSERIMRTLLDCEDKKEIFRTKDKENFHDQIKEIPFIDEIFGAKAETGRIDKKGLGALAIDDCFAVESFDRKNWTAVQQGNFFDGKSYFETTTTNINGKEVDEITLHQALRKIDLDKDSVSETERKAPSEKFVIEHHNAIDRFTGGASDGALYSVLAPTKIGWDEMRFSLDLSRIQDDDKEIEKHKRRGCVMLLLLVLRDLAENRLPLGFATNRGMGEIKVKGIELTGRNLKEIDLDGEISTKMENEKFVASDTLKKLGGEKWWETK